MNVGVAVSPFSQATGNNVGGPLLTSSASTSTSTYLESKIALFSIGPATHPPKPHPTVKFI